MVAFCLIYCSWYTLHFVLKFLPRKLNDVYEILALVSSQFAFWYGYGYFFKISGQTTLSTVFSVTFFFHPACERFM